MAITVQQFREEVEILGASYGLSDTALNERTRALNALIKQLPRNDWSRTYLKGANLSNLDLRGAYLWGADFTGADLKEANLTGAILQGADFTGADLTGATGIRT